MTRKASVYKMKNFKPGLYRMSGGLKDSFTIFLKPHQAVVMFELYDQFGYTSIEREGK